MTTLLATFDFALFIKGMLTVIMAFTLFIGSIYVLLAAIFGLRMGYLVLAVSFFSWMIILSAIWSFGFKAQGPETPINLGPRFTEEHWQPVGAGLSLTKESTPYPEVSQYPNGVWKEPVDGTDPKVHNQAADVDPAATAMKTFIAQQTNKQYGIEPIEAVPEHAGGTLEDDAQLQEAQLANEGQAIFEPENFVVEDVRFATAEDGRQLVAGKAFYTGGGPQYTVVAVYDKGKVWLYSYLFLFGSIIGLAIHLPFLDRAEAKRKDILTGGSAPMWRGPA